MYRFIKKTTQKIYESGSTLSEEVLMIKYVDAFS